MNTVEVKVNGVMTEGVLLSSGWWNCTSDIDFLPGQNSTISLTINNNTPIVGNVKIAFDATSIVWPVSLSSTEPVNIFWELEGDNSYQYVEGRNYNYDPDNPNEGLVDVVERHISPSDRTFTLPSDFLQGLAVTAPSLDYKLQLSNANLLIKNRHAFISFDGKSESYPNNRQITQEEPFKQDLRIIKKILDMQ